MFRIKNSTIFTEIIDQFISIFYETTRFRFIRQSFREYVTKIVLFRRRLLGTSSFGWLLLAILILLILTFLFARHRRRRQSINVYLCVFSFNLNFLCLEDMIMIPVGVPSNEQQGPVVYHPSPTGNLYVPCPQNYDGGFNPYLQQQQVLNSFQQQSNNPYSVKEGKSDELSTFNQFNV